VRGAWRDSLDFGQRDYRSAFGGEEDIEQVEILRLGEGEHGEERFRTAASYEP
jgi:hypothetical protein